MTLDLAQFHDTFFAESSEALDSMENALLKLSAGDADLELINTIFRVAHSIKGGSATFGFSTFVIRPWRKTRLNLGSVAPGNPDMSAARQAAIPSQIR